ncbi:MAG: hypothetical protein PGN23_04740 [Sphingomonas adhaesiva]|uniref:hypothetical protein n=1 Tax=Sphingomonas adhaesiva TaxID=28212 RepID=UPI002FF82109
MAIVTGGPGTVTLGAGDRVGALAAVKAQLRAGLPDDDVLIVAYAETALGLAEGFTGQVLIARDVTVDVRGRAEWQLLPARPVRAITAAGAGVDIDAGGNGWVRTIVDARVTLSAGVAADWASLPAALRQGVVVLAAHLFTDREGRAPIPAAVSALWRPYRVMALAQAAHA